MAMAVYPDTLTPNSAGWGLKSRAKPFRSPLSGRTQTVGFHGSRWKARLNFAKLAFDRGLEMDAFMGQLEGTNGRFQLYPHTRPTPRGAGTVAPASSNLMQWSGDQWGAGVGGSTNSALIRNAALAPDGTMTADKLVGNAGITTRKSVYQTFVPTATTDYCGSLYLKAGEVTVASFWLDSTGWSVGGTNVDYPGANGTINLLTGVASDTRVKVIDAGNGWWRVYVGATTLASPPTSRLHVSLGLPNGADGIVGDGASGIYVWGAQMERGVLVPSPYMPSADSFTSRAAGPATYMDSTGVVRYAGLNYFLNSNDFLASQWDRTNVVPSVASIAGPSGISTVWKVVANTTNSGHYMTQDFAVTYQSGTPYTVSAHFKAGEYNLARLSLPSSAFPASGRGALFNLTTGTLDTAEAGVVAFIESLGDGWYRASVTAVANATATGLAGLSLANASGNAGLQGFAGNGVNGIYAAGLQLVIGTVPCDYVATTTAGKSAARLDNKADFTRKQNLLPSSQTLNSWNKATGVAVNQTATLAPDGTLTGNKLTEGTANQAHTIGWSIANEYQHQLTPFCFSIYLKAGERSAARLSIKETGTFSRQAAMIVDLSTGSILSSNPFNGMTITRATATYDGNGWFRVVLSGLIGGTQSGVYCEVCPTIGTTQSYTGNGTSGIYAWGAQLNAGVNPDAYQATTTVAVTTWVSNGVKSAGLLAEAAITNGFNNSENFAAAWSPLGGGGVHPNVVIAPDGRMTASRMQEGALSNQGQGIYRSGLSVTAGTVYCASFFVKASDYGFKRYPSILWGTEGFTGYPGCVFDIEHGTVRIANQTATIIGYGMERYPNGWVRIWSTCTATTTTANTTVQLRPSSSQGDQYANQVADGISGLYVWGAQLEQGLVPTSYQPNFAGFLNRSGAVATSFDINGNLIANAANVARVDYGLADTIATQNRVRLSQWTATPGTPGILPANTGVYQSPNVAGITRSIVGTGVWNGYNYVDLRYAGTATGSGELTFGLEQASFILLAGGMPVNVSAYVACVGGSIPAGWDVRLRAMNYSGSSWLTEGAAVCALTGEMQRFNVQNTTLTNADRVSPALSVNVGGAGSIDLTIRIAMPQISFTSGMLDPLPTTGTAITTYLRMPRLLTEVAVTNSIRNNSMAGAVANTPGSIPTNWVYEGAGLTLSQQIVATGTVGGLPYMDIRLFGTATAGLALSLCFDSRSACPALSGQTFTLSAFMAVVGGSWANISACNLRHIGRATDGSGVEFASGAELKGSLTNYLKRFSSTTTFANASTAYDQPGFTFSMTAGAVDITLRIAAPQLENRGSPTSVVLTSVGGVTRNADSFTTTFFSRAADVASSVGGSRTVVGPYVTTAGQVGRSLAVGGFTASTVGVLKAGDYFEVNGELKICTADVNSDLYGSATIQFSPPLRASPPAQTVINLNKPKCLMRLTDESYKMIRRAALEGYQDLVIDCEEVFL